MLTEADTGRTEKAKFEKVTIEEIQELERQLAIAIKAYKFANNQDKELKNKDKNILSAAEKRILDDNAWACDFLLNQCIEIEAEIETKNIYTLCQEGEIGVLRETLKSKNLRLCLEGKDPGLYLEEIAPEALHYAAIAGKKDMVQYLMKKKANPLLTNHRGFSVLQEALSHRQTEIACFLHRKGFDLSAQECFDLLKEMPSNSETHKYLENFLAPCVSMTFAFNAAKQSTAPTSDSKTKVRASKGSA